MFVSEYFDLGDELEYGKAECTDKMIYVFIDLGNPGRMIYHKHSRKTEYYHRHWKIWSVAKSVESIKQHDRYVLGIAS